MHGECFRWIIFLNTACVSLYPVAGYYDFDKKSVHLQAMRILVFTTLFPNAASPNHGVFVANRLSAYRNKYDADIKVIAPVPWFPFSHHAFGQYADWARAPKHENVDDIDVYHPRYFVPPKVAMHFSPAALRRCLRKEVKRLNESGWDFDLIDAHYFYPDGVAAADIAREFDKPLIITARGTDVNFLPRYAPARKKIINAANTADAIITVAEALKRELSDIGVQQEKITVLRNGVDLKKFTTGDRDRARRILGLDGLVLASVGHLIERKGHDRVIKALAEIHGATLLIAGEGAERKALEKLAISLGVRDRVHFLGRVPHDELAEIYRAADILVLASSREGWPNVLLEAMACGTPCIANDVWGASEVIRTKQVGRLIRDRRPEEIVATVNDLVRHPSARKDVRTYAESHSWGETADGMEKIFNELAGKSKRRSSVSFVPLSTIEENYRPRLIVTVDTEEQFDWREFDNVDYTVNSPEDVDAFQKLCAGYGVKPLYFLTRPFLKDDRTAGYFKNLVESGKADCGIHLHQWTTPPNNFTGEFFSYQKNLPRDVYEKKLNSLTAAYEQVFKSKAIAHRAGRYGVGPEDYPLLSDAGVQFDFSPSAAFDFSDRGGPDFSAMSNRPFVAESGGGARVFVTPVSGACAIRRTNVFLSQEKTPPGFPVRRKNKFSTLKIPVRLSPEGAIIEDMKSLARKLMTDKTPVFTFTLHSTSLSAGGNAYAPHQAQVEEMLDKTAKFLAWFKEDIGGEVLSFKSLRETFERQA
ncbi:glycosyltransferase [Hyphococcus flavus]|uniref:Glycosyltransferase n=1 Tax=Hyphococcus flavus TaxID=1866326 RepID=A0AAE9ZBY9_9PROT|nr:glycosyltransferase [Hyphococcus flavus]WDI32003.1 glycosyltransferase [Hyphococcus flavus]